MEKPLATLWRNYTQNSKPDVMMKLCLCPSGLKATTRQHGLTEYWSHRITYCSSPKNYPRVFCWIYRHEGRKLKHEFRCHAVICSKESVALEISTILKVRGPQTEAPVTFPTLTRFNAVLFFLAGKPSQSPARV